MAGPDGITGNVPTGQFDYAANPGGTPTRPTPQQPQSDQNSRIPPNARFVSTPRAATGSLLNSRYRAGVPPTNGGPAYVIEVDDPSDKGKKKAVTLDVKTAVDPAVKLENMKTCVGLVQQLSQASDEILAGMYANVNNKFKF